MGGLGSTRWNWEATKQCLEDGLTLDIKALLKHCGSANGKIRIGQLNWTLRSSGERIASVSFEYAREGDDGWVEISHTKGSQRIYLSTTRPNYGGRRWWFVCPITGQRAAKLYLPGGGTTQFASRQAYRLAYRSTRQDRHDRLVAKAQAIHVRLGGDGNIQSPFPDKPRGMWWSTYSRLYLEYKTANEGALGEFMEMCSRLFAKGLRFD